MRYRLRFHLQEVDLSTEEVLIGRGPECHLTIDDPMLSRQHARIELGSSAPYIEDLRSRNGTKLNGAPLMSRAALQDGDRIRLGTQELVFLQQSTSKRNFRTTSGLIFCAGCGVPYPSTGVECPHCGQAAAEGTDVSTERDMPANGWTFLLLAQVVQRAVQQGRLADAERMLARGLSELDDRLEDGAEVGPNHILGIAECATRLGCALQTRRWLEDGARLYAHVQAHPSLEVLGLLDALPTDARLTDVVRLLRQAASDARQAG